MTTLTMLMVVDGVDKKEMWALLLMLNEKLMSMLRMIKMVTMIGLMAMNAKMKMEKLKRLSLASSTLLSLNIYSSRRFCKMIIITPIVATSS